MGNKNGKRGFQSKRLINTLGPFLPVEASGHFDSLLDNLTNLHPILVKRMRIHYNLPHL